MRMMAFLLLCFSSTVFSWRISAAPYLFPGHVIQGRRSTLRNDPPIMASFSEIGLRPSLLQFAQAKNWKVATNIQEFAIPAILDGRNVWAEAPTGSGKTAAFVLPLVQSLEEAMSHSSERHVRILVVAPTRELVEQTTEVFRSCSTRLRTLALYGGEPIDRQMRELAIGADVIVATPGRLLDIIQRRFMTQALQRVSTFVLDEADRLLSTAFAAELDAIMELLPLPERRQTLLIGATFPYKSRPKAKQMFGSSSFLKLDSELMNIVHDGNLPNDKRANNSISQQRYGSAPPPSTILQRAIRVDLRDRTSLLRHLVGKEDWGRVLVFVGSAHTAERVAFKLREKGIAVEALHSKLRQGLRDSRLEALRQYRLRVLIATDLAARGIDVQGLEAIVNYELPRSTSEYVHRVGRTGRAGEKGVAISFIASTGPGNEGHFQLIERRSGGMLVPRETIKGFEPKDSELLHISVPKEEIHIGKEAKEQAEQQSPIPGVKHSKYGLAHDRMHGGIKGKRMSKKDKLRAATSRELARERSRE